MKLGIALLLVGTLSTPVLAKTPKRAPRRAPAALLAPRPQPAPTAPRTQPAAPQQPGPSAPRAQQSSGRCAGGKEFVLSPGVKNDGGKHGSYVSMKVGDVNGDGLLDLITGSNPTGVYLNKGNGTFAPVVNTEWPWAALANEIVVGDWNGDGKLDIAGGGDGGNGRYTYMFGNGDGTFKKGVQFEYGDGANDTSMVAIDLNRDGHVDMAATAYPGIKVFLNPGDGKFTGGVDYVAKGKGLVAADFTGDGKVDLATYDKENVYIYPGKAGGTFGAAQPIEIRGDGPMGDGLVAADFDGDGKVDIAALGESGYNSTINVLRNTGNGTFASPVQFKVADQGEARALAAGDLNGDGHPDLAVSNRKTVIVYLNDGHGKFGAPLSVSAGWQNSGNAMSGEIAIAALDKSGLGSVVLMQDSNGIDNHQVMVFKGACD